jgi:hypothetical protein
LKLKRSEMALLMAGSIILCVVAFAFAPVIRLMIFSHGPSALGVFNTEKPLVQSGSFAFTLGDLVFIVSLVAAACTIALFVQSVRKR